MQLRFGPSDPFCDVRRLCSQQVSHISSTLGDIFDLEAFFFHSTGLKRNST